MAIPPPPGPPPPPSPPPPPAMGNLKLGGAAGGDARSALLQSIQKGTKLKKATTVDKSGPALAGKVRGSSSTASPTISPKRSINNNSNTSNNNNIGNGTPKLSGLFEGLSSMPKLKPVNGSRVTSSPRSNNDTTNDRSGSPPTKQSTITTNNATKNNSNSNSPMDFNAELTKHLTLKRQKQQQPQINATEANLKTNRGPPPQPPAGLPKVFSSNTNDVEKSKVKASSPTLSEASVGSGSSSNSSNRIVGNNAAGSVRSKAANLNLNLGNNNVNSKSSQFTSTTLKKTATKTSTNYNNNNINKNSQKSAITINSFTKTTTANATVLANNLAPNKSTLFGNSNVGGGNTPNDNSNAFNKSPTPCIKPVPNHGKPNFAPKPPGLQQMSMANGQHQRPIVARHHSMRSPRSPPIAPGGGPVFPTQQHFGTLRTPLNLCQSQDGINTGLRTAPNPPIGRPTVAPPKPPTVKPPPPPTPARSISNSNLNNMSSVPCAAINSALINSSSASTTNSSPATTQPPSTSSSSNSVAALRDQFRAGSISGSISTVSASTPPPPPPPSSTTMSTLTKTNSGSPLSGKSGIKPIILNGGPLNAPPLPPHRTCPAPPPPQRQTSNSGLNVGNVAPPVPPQRYSSIRAGAPTTPPNLGNQTAPYFGSGTATANNTQVSRLVIDLESRFGKRFHNVTEFPKPPPFLNIQKVYPSRTVKATNVNVNSNSSTTITATDSNNSLSKTQGTAATTATSSTSSSTSIVQPTKPLQPAFVPMKKNRAPLPPPQARAGIAAATVTVIRNSSFLYGSAQQ